MNWFVTAITTGIAAFAATNIDDIVVLMLFFAQVNATFRRWHIVAGQYLGFTAIIFASLPGFFGGLIVPRTWIGLLGLVPIVIGISYLLKKTTNSVQEVAEHFARSPSNSSVFSKIAGILSPQIYSVAAVTIANGGDNIGIYVPLFASSDIASLLVILSVFFMLVGVWCYVGYQLTRYRIVAKVITRYSDALIPFVFIGLGIFILIESGTVALLPFL